MCVCLSTRACACVCTLGLVSHRSDLLPEISKKFDGEKFLKISATEFPFLTKQVLILRNHYVSRNVRENLNLDYKQVFFESLTMLRASFTGVDRPS